MGQVGDVTKAVKLYRAFRETAPKRAQRFDMRLPGALARMGPCEFIGYMTTHKGKAALYVHYFAPGSRPVMYAGPGRQQLYFVGGRYHVTAGGITDLDPQGKIIDYNGRYVVKQRRHNKRQRRSPR
jgi:hypothetical protein